MAAAIKMDELLVQWVSRDAVYENVLSWIENYSVTQATEDNHTHVVTQLKQINHHKSLLNGTSNSGTSGGNGSGGGTSSDESDVYSNSNSNSNSGNATTLSDSSPVTVVPPFYPVGEQKKSRRRHGNASSSSHNNNNNNPYDTWEEASVLTEAIFEQGGEVNDEGEWTLALTSTANNNNHNNDNPSNPNNNNPNATDPATAALNPFVRLTKEVCHFPSYFAQPLFARIASRYGNNRGRSTAGDDGTTNPTSPHNNDTPTPALPTSITLPQFQSFWMDHMEGLDPMDRFFHLVKHPDANHIGRDDFLPFLKALLADHPGLEFLSSHAEFQEKYAVTVITRIFYTVNVCSTGRITARQVRRSDLLDAFWQVDVEEDINKVTRYFSYEHFYVLYCRFWELDHDRDYRIAREDLLKYGDHSLSHMIVDRIFDAAPRPFCESNNNSNHGSTPAAADGETNTAAVAAAANREYLSYEDFIYFMLSEEDKSNDVAVRYWFSCVDVDGDGKLNNMEMRSFYAVQLHRMQCMGHEIVPFEDMLCQMMDMIKPKHPEYLVQEDFLQPECAAVSGVLFDALFNLNKYLLFEQRDPFVERQRREDEFNTDWDRFACIDYNRLAMEEEAREEEAMEIDWVTVDDEEEEQQQQHGANSDDSPF